MDDCSLLASQWLSEGEEQWNRTCVLEHLVADWERLCSLVTSQVSDDCGIEAASAIVCTISRLFFRSGEFPVECSTANELRASANDRQKFETVFEELVESAMKERMTPHHGRGAGLDPKDAYEVQCTN